MKTYAYLRVSGASQVDGDGERRQADAVVEFCRLNGLELSLETFFEKAISGTVEGLDRPEFARLLERCEAGDAIVVERMDRLARDLMVQELLLKECRERGVKVFTTDQGGLYDQASNQCDPSRVLIRQIFGALAQWEKSALVLKLKKARDAKRARGEYCGGNVSYGATEAEKQILEVMRTLKAAGETPYQIAEVLNVGGYRTRTGKHWTFKNVKAILYGWNLRSHRKVSA